VNIVKQEKGSILYATQSEMIYSTCMLDVIELNVMNMCVICVYVIMMKNQSPW